MRCFMNITKYETNFRRNLFLSETSTVNFTPDVYKEENKLINIYPSIEFQEFLGFGRCPNSGLHVIIYLLALRKILIKF